ncbi:MAG TPA: hypothetical protein VLS45_00605, partial [Methylomicrobium sp.]|nr:hypothetical protein [Methylomicrobium sp.]
MASPLHPTLRNIVPNLGEDAVKTLSREVTERFKVDLESAAEWREMHAEWMEVYFQRDTTAKPFDGASEDSLPILAEAVDQFQARALKAMFPARGRKAIRVIPTGSVDNIAIERAKRIEKHLQWQLIDSQSMYRTTKDLLLTSLPLHGSVFSKVHRCPLTGRLAVSNVRATDLVVPYGSGSRSIEDLPRKTEISWLPAHQAQRLTATGYFSEAP